jgi:hypothetical protein
MVRRHLIMPHRLAVVTDLADELGDGIEIIKPPRDFEDVRIPTWGPAFPQCLRRLAMFAPNAAETFGSRFVSMDMDCFVSDSLDPLFDCPDDFVMYRGTTNKRPYNGSMLLMTAGARAQVYTDFTPGGAVEAGKRFVGSDQAWISHVLGWGEKTWGPEHGVHLYGSQYNHEAPARVTFFPGTPKPWQLQDDPLIAEHYRRDPQGRLLILGYAPTVWADADLALETGPFDAVIASPEAAEHWPGEVLAVATDDDHAERLARMHGFEDVTWCGRTDRAVA